MTRLIIATALCALLTACAGVRGPMPPKIVVQASKVAVAVPCAAPKVTRPAWATPAQLQAAPNIWERAKLYASDRQTMLDYIAKLEPASAGCAPPSK